MKKVSKLLTAGLTAMLLTSWAGQAMADEVIGTYDLGLVPTTMFGVKSPAVKCQVEVVSQGSSEFTELYVMRETGSTNYFYGVEIPMEYNSATGKAQITAFDAGKIGSDQIWVWPFIFNGTFTEPQENYLASFNPQTGFSMPEGAGLGWFICSADGTPMDLKAAYYITDDPGEDNPGGGDGGEDNPGGSGNYPAESVIYGNHTLTADVTLSPGYEYLAEVLPASKEFEIDGGLLSNFIGTQASVRLNYDQNTGKLTMTNNNLGFYMTPDFSNSCSMGMTTPDGAWSGVGNCSVLWQVTEDGKIVIPDFAVVNTGASGNPIVAQYTNVKVDGYVPGEGGGDDNGDDDIPADNDPSKIEGTWSFPVYDYTDDATNKTPSFEYIATLSGKTVTFTSPDSQFNMVAEFTDNSTLAFKYAQVGPDAKYALHQSPFVNEGTPKTEAGIFELVTLEALIGKYNSEKGTITFPANEGLRFGYFDSDGKLNFWQVAYEFTAPATQTAGLVPEITIYNLKPEFGDMSLTVTFDVETQYFNISEVKEWKGILVESFFDNVNENDWTETSYYPATVENGKGTIVIPELTAGRHNFSFAIAALDADGKEIAVSNSKDVAFTAGGELNIIFSEAVAEGSDVTVTFRGAPYAIDPAKIAYYKAVFTDLLSITDDYAGDTYTVDAELADNVGTAVLTDLSNGVYDFGMVIVAYDAADQPLLTSNTLQFVVEVTESNTGGVESIDAENGAARYFDLQGREVLNPERGIYIVKQGNKVKKILK